jgi:hypothetical protein
MAQFHELGFAISQLAAFLSGSMDYLLGSSHLTKGSVSASAFHLWGHNWICDDISHMCGRRGGASAFHTIEEWSLMVQVHTQALAADIIVYGSGSGNSFRPGSIRIDRQHKGAGD